MQEELVEVRGQSLRVMQAGTGAPLLFLHGAGGSVWSPLLERLSLHWRVLAPEHPGFGRTQIPGWMMSVGDLAFFYLDFMEALGLTEVTLVGHSLGGWTAAEIAIRNTVRLKSLVLMAPAGVADPQTPFGDIFLWSPEEAARRSVYDRGLAEARIRDLATADIDIVLQNKAATARLAWNPRLSNPQLPYWLHCIDRPTLLVWGREDQICPFGCHQAYLREIADAELFALPETGHVLGVERPAEIADKIHSFCLGARP